jgi:hypothetical protein
LHINKKGGRAMERPPLIVRIIIVVSFGFFLLLLLALLSGVGILVVLILKQGENAAANPIVSVLLGFSAALCILGCRGISEDLTPGIGYIGAPGSIREHPNIAAIFAALLSIAVCLLVPINGFILWGWTGVVVLTAVWILIEVPIVMSLTRHSHSRLSMNAANEIHQAAVGLIALVILTWGTIAANR